jgi:hypothetical protein
MAGAIAASFTELVHRGTSVVEALDAITPALDALDVQLTEAGLVGGQAFEGLRAMAALAHDEIAGPALEGVAALGQAMAGLHNSGILNQTMFSGLAGQIGSTFESLVAQGYDGDTALLLMQPTLQTLWQLMTDYGYAVDDTTQALIDQGLEQGIIGEGMRSVDEQILGVLKLIARALGVELPEAARTGAREANEALATITAPDLTVRVRSEWDGIVLPTLADLDLSGVEQPDIEPPAFASGTPGLDYASFSPRGTFAVLHNQEAVIPKSGSSQFAADVAAALAPHLASARGGGAQRVVLEQHTFLDGRPMKMQIQEWLIDGSLVVPADRVR